MKPSFKKLIVASLIISHIPLITHHSSLITPTYADAKIEEIMRFDDNWNVQTTKVGDSTPLYFNSNGDLKIATPGMVSSSMAQLANAFSLPSIKSYISNWQDIALSVAIYALASYFPTVKEAISSANYMANEAGKLGGILHKDTINIASLSGKPANITQACVVAKIGKNPFTSNTDEIQNAINDYIKSHGQDEYQKLVSQCSVNGNLASLLSSASIDDLRKYLDSKSLRKAIDTFFTQKFGIADNSISYAVNSQNIKSIAQTGDADKIGELLALAVTPEATVDDNGNLALKEMKDENNNTITPDWIDKQTTLGIYDDFINNVFKPLESSTIDNPMPLDEFLRRVQTVYDKYGIKMDYSSENGEITFNDDFMVKVYLQWIRYSDKKDAVESLKANNQDHSKDGEIIEKQKEASELYGLYTKSRDLAIGIIVDEFDKKVLESAYTHLKRADAKAKDMEKQMAEGVKRD
jgi:hypothetical protein